MHLPGPEQEAQAVPVTAGTKTTFYRRICGEDPSSVVIQGTVLTTTKTI